MLPFSRSPPLDDGRRRPILSVNSGSADVQRTAFGRGLVLCPAEKGAAVLTQPAEKAKKGTERRTSLCPFFVSSAKDSGHARPSVRRRMKSVISPPTRVTSAMNSRVVTRDTPDMTAETCRR